MCCCWRQDLLGPADHRRARTQGGPRNDVDLKWQAVERGTPLKGDASGGGLRGATRRMLKGCLPASRVAAIASHVPAKVIPWSSWM